MRYTLFLVVILFFSACKRPPLNTSPTIAEEAGKDTANVFVGKGFRYLKATCKVNFKDAQNNIGFKIHLRLKKDSVIWVMVSKFGIEGMRALITPDSMHILDAQKNTYTAAKFDTLQKLLNFRLDFSMLQAALLANMPIPVYDSNTVAIENGLLKINQERDGIAITNVLQQANRKLHELHLKDLKNNNLLVLIYQNFQDHLGGNLFANLNEATITSWNKSTRQTEVSEIKMDYNEVKFSHRAIEFPFSIPAKYKKQ